MNYLPFESAKAVFLSGKAANVVVMGSEKKWIFTFETQIEGQLKVCCIETQRGKIRTWADPRLLFSLLKDEFMCVEGQFKIKELKQ